MSIHELKNTIRMITPKGKGYAFLVQDIGAENDLLWTVAQDNGEIWTWRNRKVRLVENITMGRHAQQKVPDSKADHDLALYTSGYREGHAMKQIRLADICYMNGHAAGVQDRSRGVYDERPPTQERQDK